MRWLNHYMMYYDNFTENMYFCSVTTILKLHIGRKINSVYKDENVTKNQSKLGQQKMHKKSEKNISRTDLCTTEQHLECAGEILKEKGSGRKLFLVSACACGCDHA